MFTHMNCPEVHMLLYFLSISTLKREGEKKESEKGNLSTLKETHKSQILI